MENQNGVTAPKQTAITLLNQDNVKQKFKEILGNKSAAFITSVLGVVNQSELLKKATPDSVYMAAMMAAALDLPINPNLGFAYIIPYNSRDNNGNYISVAQFQMGYRGFIQLAQRSGQYKTISATPVYEGQLTEQDPLKGFVFDWTAKKSDRITGYAAYFSLVNGFEKTLYMTVEALQSHGSKYSKTYSKESSKWKTDFEAMALKTVTKLLISKYGPLSVDIQMQKAVTADQAVIHDAETMDVEYTDAPVQELQPADTKESEEITRVRSMIADAKTVEAVEKIRPKISKLPEAVRNDVMMELETRIETLQAA